MYLAIFLPRSHKFHKVWNAFDCPRLTQLAWKLKTEITCFKASEIKQYVRILGYRPTKSYK